MVKGIPLLDLVEALEKGNGDEDGNGLLAVADLDLWEEKLSAVFDFQIEQIEHLQKLVISTTNSSPIVTIQNVTHKWKK